MQAVPLMVLRCLLNRILLRVFEDIPVEFDFDLRGYYYTTIVSMIFMRVFLFC